ncbi:MAG: M28 family peptidase [Aquificaceae bacterium]
MKSEKLEALKELAYKILNNNRLTGARESKKAQRLIEKFLEENSCPYQKESFSTRAYIPEKALIEVEGKKIQGVAFLGSKSVEIKGFVKRDYVEGDIALIPDLTKEKALEAQQKGATAIITYDNNLDGFIYGPCMGVDIPILSLKREDIKSVEDFNIKLYISSSEKSVEGENLIMDVGKGPIIYFVAHRDTVHESYGAISNGIGFLLLLFLFQEIRNNYNVPYRLRFLITEARELGLKGASFHVERGLKHAFYCINLEGIGWHNPCVIYEDMGGYNGERINEMFYKHLRDLKVNIDFCRAKERDGDHIPFKEKGLQSLFLSSHPFTIRYTQYDLYDAINWDVVVMWYEVILSFLRRFHKL